MNEPISPKASESFGPTAPLETLRLRACLLAAVRSNFAAHGYWEVETPILSHETIVDAHLDPFVVHDRCSGELFLQTSPELGMKRLIAFGADSIYQITRAMRRDEAGERHNPEFTIVEWYRVGDTYHDQMNFTEQLVKWVAQELLSTELWTHPENRDSTMAAEAPDFFLTDFDRLSYDSAFERFAGTRVLNMSPQELSDLAQRHNVEIPESLSRDDCDGWRNLLLAELIEPNLGFERPVFLYDYPASQAALARVRPEDPPVAERFELYVRGIEICNGYDELTDVSELEARISEQTQMRIAASFQPLPQPSHLIAAMCHGLPQCAGVALGFDRLMMVLLRTRSMADVTAFPLDRA